VNPFRPGETPLFLGKQASETTYLRQRLIESGLLCAKPARRREMTFITPALVDYISERADDLDM
jgi:helix-turn-helix protein